MHLLPLIRLKSLRMEQYKIMTTKTVYSPTDNDINEAADIIRQGGTVVFPTETVYGLGASALDKEAARKIYSAKGRPSDNPLIIHLSTPNDAEKYCYTNELFYKISEKFMPGPITVILKKKECIPYEVTGGLDTVALRVPSNEIARKLIDKAGVPVAAPSANTSGKPSPTRVEHVVDDLDGKVDMILNGGQCDIGLESTIVKICDENIKLLRPGAVTYEELCQLFGSVEIDKCVLEKIKSNDAPEAPGMKYRHYAPDVPVVLVSGSYESVTQCLKNKAVSEKCGVVCFDEDYGDISSCFKFSLGKKENSDEHAHRLFDILRKLDGISVDVVYIPMPDKSGLNLALYNRLLKASGYKILNSEEM